MLYLVNLNYAELLYKSHAEMSSGMPSKIYILEALCQNYESPFHLQPEREQEQDSRRDFQSQIRN